MDMGQEKDFRNSGLQYFFDVPFIEGAKDAEAGIEQNRPVAVQEIGRDLAGPDDVESRDYLSGCIENQIDAFLNKRSCLGDSD